VFVKVVIDVFVVLLCCFDLCVGVSFVWGFVYVGLVKNVIFGFGEVVGMLWLLDICVWD